MIAQTAYLNSETQTRVPTNMEGEHQIKESVLATRAQWTLVLDSLRALHRRDPDAGPHPRTGQAVPAEDVETVIRAAAGEDALIGALDGRAAGAAQTAMLSALTREGGASADAIVTR